MNRAQRRAKDFRKNRQIVGELRMEGARYALNIYRQAVCFVLGIGEKRLQRIDDKFNELLIREEVVQEMKKRGEL